MRQLNPRARAALILAQLRAGKGSLSSLIQSRASNSDEALIQELCFGTCRYFQELEYLASSLMDKPLRNKDDDIACLILIGLYQLRHLRVPDHAAVHESVAGARMLGKPWAAGLVNAVLRNYLKNQNALSLALEAAGPEVRHSHPLWLVDLLRNDWPQDWEQILVANNQHPPMVLRVNLAKTDRATYMHELQKAGITAVEGALGPAAIILQTPCNVDVLPGFSLGMVSVQDQASQLVPPLLELSPGNRVLDACSAPGGKTAHLLESERSLTSLLALDTSRSRLAAVKENLQRLGLMAEVACGDAADPASWWDGREFDRILLDAPCSATGVIRRHPDIKLLRRPADITPFAAKQLALLEALWACLAPGGLLLYCTCSVLRQENQGVIKEFLSRESGAKYAAISADWGVKCASGRQLLPGRESSDGFYFCRLIKQ